MSNNNPFIMLQHFHSVSNPNSMHGLYPYRGKISALDAQSIISQLPQKGVLLDPFCGSGTIVYEAQKHGLQAIGVDNNPLAIQVAKAKVYKNNKLCLENCMQLIELARKDYERGKYSSMPSDPLRSFHAQTANQIMCMTNYFEEMDDYLRGVFYGSIALAARGCNGYKWTSTTVGKNIEPKVYINFFDKMLSKAKKHAKYFASADSLDARIISGDSRFLSDYIEPGSVDFVFTSPPYFDGLDYTAYYGKLIYEIFGIDRVEIKQKLIQYVDSYENDMRAVFTELDKVTNNSALMIFVVGDKKIKKEVINGGSFFNKIKPASYIMERGYTSSSSQVFDVLNNTHRKEQIVVWDKSNGEVLKHDRL